MKNAISKTASSSNKSRRPRLPIAEAMKNAATGRPSKYDPKFVAAMDAFFDCEAIERIVTKDGNVKHVFKSYPTFERFALSIGVVPDTLRRWASETLSDGKTMMHPEFTDAYARAKARQNDLMQVGGLSGAYSPAMAVLGAKNNLGWKDKLDIDQNNTNSFPDLSDLDEIYRKGDAAAKALNATVGK